MKAAMWMGIFFFLAMAVIVWYRYTPSELTDAPDEAINQGLTSQPQPVCKWGGQDYSGRRYILRCTWKL